uniref:Uncharacterized protein n=1 Tax=Timema shepardi TaxID=629360 RepID=A0A7R9B749_TIMSH|nr:unnamed protein product [Timema shepardi]
MSSSGDGTNITKNDQSNLTAQLRDEYYRSLIGQKLKREEIRRLKSQLENKDKIIKKLKDDETNYLAQAEKFKQDATNFLAQLSKQEEFSKQMENLSKENRNLCEQLEHSGGERSKLTTELQDVRKEKEALEMENEQLKERIHELVQKLDNEKVSTIEQYNKEYFKFHDEALARVRQEKYEQAEAQVIDLRFRWSLVVESSWSMLVLFGESFSRCPLLSSQTGVCWCSLESPSLDVPRCRVKLEYVGALWGMSLVVESNWSMLVLFGESFSRCPLLSSQTGVCWCSLESPSLDVPRCRVKLEYVGALWRVLL